MEKPAYRPDVDGLRAVAVLSVIFYHAGFNRFFGGGYVGVDVFFVISGYIIARMIASQLASGSWSFLDFYERRFRRILPPLFCTVLLTLPIIWLTFYDAAQLQQALKMLKRVVLGLSNFYLYANTGGYFDTPARSLPFLHTWSLAVEEQFYLFLPIILWLLWTCARKKVLPVLAGLALLSLILSGVMVHVDPRFDFYMLPTRSYELLLGVLLALGEKRWPCRAPALTHLIGLILIGLCVFLFGSVPGDAFPGLWALLPCLGTALCIWAGSRAEPASAREGNAPLTVRLLGSRPMRGVGLISYGLYLYHWPVLLFARSIQMDDAMPPLSDMILSLAAIFALSTLSYFIIEQPIRQKRVLAPQWKAFAASLGAILAFVLLAQGARRLTPYMPEEAASYLDYRDFAGFFLDKATEHEAFYAGDLGVGSAPLSFVLLGDSHAMMLGEGLHKLATERGRHGYVMVRPGGDPPFDQVEAFLERNPGIPAGLIAFRWTTRAGQPEFSDYSGQSRGRWDAASGIARQAIETMARHGVRSIFVMLPFPSQKAASPAGKATWIVKRGKRPEDFLFTSLAENRSYNSEAVALLREIAAGYPQVRLLDPVPWLCPDDEEGEAGGHCPALRDGKVLYQDDDHLSEWGCLLIQPLFEQVLAPPDAPNTVDALNTLDTKRKKP